MAEEVEHFMIREPQKARKLHIAEEGDGFGMSLCGNWMGGHAIASFDSTAESRDDLSLNRYDPEICKECKREAGLDA